MCNWTKTQGNLKGCGCWTNWTKRTEQFLCCYDQITLKKKKELKNVGEFPDKHIYDFFGGLILWEI